MFAHLSIDIALPQCERRMEEVHDLSRKTHCPTSGRFQEVLATPEHVLQALLMQGVESVVRCPTVVNEDAVVGGAKEVLGHVA